MREACTPCTDLVHSFLPWQAAKLQLEEEQARARETELQLLTEIEVLMRDLPGALRSRSTSVNGGLLSPSPAPEAVM